VKRRILGIALTLAMLASLLIGSTVLAADPIVSVDVVSPGDGDVTITTTGVDSSTWHLGEVGEVNTFDATGTFVVSYDSYVGNYGALSTYVNASSPTSAAFTMTDTHDFNILSANHSYDTEGTFTAVASGTAASMNIGSIGSMYLWSEANYPYSTPALQGSNISKSYSMYTDDALTAMMVVGATTTGIAVMDHSNQWGFGSGEVGSIDGSKSSSNYIVAVGTGTYQQYISAGTNVVSGTAAQVDGNPVVIGATLPGGSVNVILNFLNSLTSVYSMNGN